MKLRAGIRLRQRIVSPMAVGAAGNTLGITDIHHLAVIGFLVIPDGLGRKIIPFGHLCIGMASPATPGIGLAGGCDIPFLGQVIERNVMQAVTVGARRRILIALRQSTTMPQKQIIPFIMTPDTVLNDGQFRVLPSFPDDVNLPVTILTGQVLLNGMNVLPVPDGNIPVTTGAVYRCRPDRTRDVPGQIRDVRVAARTTVLSVSGTCESFAECVLGMTGLTGSAAPHGAGE